MYYIDQYDRIRIMNETIQDTYEKFDSTPNLSMDDWVVGILSRPITHNTGTNNNEQDSFYIRETTYLSIFDSLYSKIKEMYLSNRFNNEQNKEIHRLVGSIFQGNEQKEYKYKELKTLITLYQQNITPEDLSNNLNLTRANFAREITNLDIGWVKYSWSIYPTNIKASELFSRDDIINSIEGMVGVIWLWSDKNKAFDSSTQDILQWNLFAIKEWKITLPNGEIKIVTNFKISEEIGHTKLKVDTFNRKISTVLNEKKSTIYEINLKKYIDKKLDYLDDHDYCISLKEKIRNHILQCQAKWIFTPLEMSRQEVYEILRDENFSQHERRSNFWYNYPVISYKNVEFTNEIGFDRFTVNMSILVELEHSIIFSEFWKELTKMFESTGIQLTDIIIDRLFESEDNFDSRYGNGFSSMTRMMSAMTNTWNIWKIFQQMPNDIITRITNFNSTNSYVNLLKGYLISVIKKYKGDSESWWYSLFRSWLSTRDKSCKDAETYFGFILSDDTSTLIKKYRIIWDFLEKNIEREENFRTALSIKEVIVDGIRYPKWFLFRLQTKNWNILWVEPLRMTIYSSDKIMTDGRGAFWHQFKETMLSLTSDNIQPWDDLLEIMVANIENTR